MLKRINGLVSLHIAVLLFGVAGLFGKLISESPLLIVLGRVFFASIILFFLSYGKLRLKRNRDYVFVIISGILLSIHWISFFYSIQISTIAIALLSFSSFPIFTIFLEPILFKESFQFKNLLIAVLSVIGIFIIIDEIKMDESSINGILLGLFSGLTFSFLSLYNRRYVNLYSASVLAFYQNFISSLVLTPFLFVFSFNLTFINIILLMLLGTIFTALAHTLYILSLKKVQVQTASIITCLEPVYGIIIAILILSSYPTINQIIGGLFIIFSALLISVRKKT